MKRDDAKILWIFARYVFILLLAFFAFSAFYNLLLPVTIYPVNYALNFVYHSTVSGDIMTVGDFKIELVEACIAGSAYYLLLLLNFSIPLSLRKRVFSILFSFVLFLAINIVRIFIFSVMYINSFKYFSIVHLLVWYVVSGVIVFLVWLATIKTFGIEGIPFYTDIKLIYSKIVKRR